MQSEKIIIIGAGFAGLSAAGKLSQRGLGLEITLFDKKEHSDFLPLVPDCVGRGINPKFLTCDIAELCRKFKINFIQEEVVSVDFESKRVSSASADYIYDYLIIASGAQTNFFSNQDAWNYAYGLNNINDAKKITEALKSNKFEHFIVCGGGYTGVETAANLWLYFKKAGRDKKIIIVERAPVILGPLPDWMKTYVQDNLKSMGIEILPNSVIEEIQGDKVRVSARPVFEKAMLIWAPGVRTADFIQKLLVEKNPQGRIVVDEYLRVNQRCFCAGDTAFFRDKNNFLRMAAQFAISQGNQAAVNIIRSIKGLALGKFRPLDLGYIIPMANNRSCGEVFGFKARGLLATALHFMMCIFRLPGLNNRWGLICNLFERRKQMLDWGILILRLGIGIMFMAHGLQMAFGLFGGPGVKGFSTMLSSLGFFPAIFWSYVASYTVLVGGLLVILGIQTRLAAALLLIFILTAAIKVHLSKGFFLANGGFEYTFIIAATCFAFILLGPGKFRIFS